MSNFSEPIKKSRKLMYVTSDKLVIELSPSEFIDKMDPVQFFPSNPEPYSYLQYDVHNFISPKS